MAKFRKMSSPAFAQGEVWVPADGGKTGVTIVSTRKWDNSNGKYDWSVVYSDHRGMIHDKDGFSFQVRYMHISDKNNT